jgi:hypothetical protein
MCGNKRKVKRRNLVTRAPAKGVLLLSRHQVAEKLGVSIDTVKRMEHRGQLHPIYLNSRMVRYRLGDVDQMGRNRHDPPSRPRPPIHRHLGDLLP